MKRSILLLLLIVILTKTASGQFLQPIDTLCIHTNIARKLAFYKLNYKRLDTLSRLQAQTITSLQNSLDSKRELLDVCYKQTNELQKKINLLQSQLELKPKIENKINFGIKLKYISIGVGIAGVTYLIINPP